MHGNDMLGGHQKSPEAVACFCLASVTQRGALQNLIWLSAEPYVVSLHLSGAVFEVAEWPNAQRPASLVQIGTWQAGLP